MIAAPLSDQQLAAQAADRQASGLPTAEAQRACSDLYDRHAAGLFAFLAARLERAQADDAHQQIWLRVWKALQDKPFAGHFRGWLFEVARNYVFDLARKHSTDELPPNFDARDELTDTPVASLIDSERWGILKSCLKRLDTVAAALVRGRLGGQSYEELCPALGLEPAKAHRLFHSAKEQLQACVQHALA